MLQAVIELYKQFGFDKSIPFSNGEKHFRLTAMQEELDEYFESNTRVDELDALVDLQVFLLGTVYRQGFEDVFEEAFKRVMEANAKKECGTLAKRGNFKIDLVKPEGWTPPDLRDLV